MKYLNRYWLFFVCLVSLVQADEGMWLPILLEKLQ